MEGNEHDDMVLAAKQGLQPAMEPRRGDYRCLLCDERQSVDGICPNDGLPLRKVPGSES